jgi:hypothetical protein
MQHGYAPRVSKIVVATLYASSALLAACGGGGGGGSTSLPTQTNTTPGSNTNDPTPSVTLDSSSQQHAALYIQAGPALNLNLDPTAFTFANFPDTPTVQVTALADGPIGAPGFAMQDATHGGLTFTFNPPSSLGKGTYSVPFSVLVCVDSGCGRKVQTFTVTVTYTVTDHLTVDGSNGYTIAAFPLAATLLAANPSTSQVLALVPPTGTATNNSIELIEPTTGASAATPLVLTESPNNALALSDDGQYAYVNGPTLVQQIRTATLSAGINIPSPYGINTSIAVQPGHAQTFAIGYSGMELFDGTQMRPNAVNNGYQYFSLAWTSDPGVIAYNRRGNLQNTECAQAVTATGFDTSASTPCVNAPNIFVKADQHFVFASGYGYETHGAVLRESDWTVVATLPVADQVTLSTVVPDPQSGRAFALATGTGTCDLDSFALATNTPIATIRLPSVAAGDCGYSGLVRWGPDGLAFLTGTDLVVVSGNFVAP